MIKLRTCRYEFDTGLARPRTSGISRRQEIQQVDETVTTKRSVGTECKEANGDHIALTQCLAVHLSGKAPSTVVFHPTGPSFIPCQSSGTTFLACYSPSGTYMHVRHMSTSTRVVQLSRAVAHVHTAKVSVCVDAERNVATVALARRAPPHLPTLRANVLFPQGTHYTPTLRASTFCHVCVKSGAAKVQERHCLTRLLLLTPGHPRETTAGKERDKLRTQSVVRRVGSSATTD